MPFKTPNALLHGTLDALILKTLTAGPRHGYAIAKFIEDASGESVIVEEGSSVPGAVPNGATGMARSRVGRVRARPAGQALSPDARGRAQLNAETAAWRQFAAGVSKILLAPMRRSLRIVAVAGTR